MSDTPNIYFSCNHCGTQLSVPSAMSGIEGPCPKCGSRIMAPLLPTSKKISPSPRAAGIPKLLDAMGTASNPPMQPIVGSMIAGYRSSMPVASNLAAATVISSTSPSYPSPLVLPPTPPAPPKKETQLYKPFADSDVVSEGENVNRMGRQMKRKTPRAVLIMCSMLVMTALIMGGVMKFVNDKNLRQTSKKPAASTSTPIAKRDDGAVPHTLENSDDLSTEENSSVLVQLEEDAAMPVAMARHVDQIVEDFLNAGNLEERKNLIQSNLSQKTLRDSFLNKKWPITNYTFLAIKPYPEQRLLEYLYQVSFAVNGDGFPTDAIICVHHRGSNPPRIDVDPLMDTIGGQLKDYASSHQRKMPMVLELSSDEGELAYFKKSDVKEPQDFYCIIHARPFCFSPDVPDSARKATVRLCSRFDGGVITQAYMNDKSKLYERFMTRKSGIDWDLYFMAKVTLGWNVKEDRNRPFLEIINIKTVGWNR